MRCPGHKGLQHYPNEPLFNLSRANAKACACRRSESNPMILRGTSTALSLLLATSAFAEPTSFIDRIFVDGQLLGSLTAPSVSSAYGNLRKTPGAVALVPEENYERRFTLNLEDMLGNVPGVFAKKRFAEEVRLSIRGSGLSRSFHMRGITLLQDGVPLTLADNSSDFQEIAPLSLRYTEIYKGANALKYGATNLGGAINFVMPTGRTATAPIAARLEGGSFKTMRAHGHVSHADEKTDTFLAATVTRSDGYRDHSDMLNGRVFANVGINLSDQAETRFYFVYNNINQKMPGTLEYDDALTRPKMALPAIWAGDQARDVRSLRSSNRTVIKIGDSIATFGLYVIHKSLDHPIFQVVDQNIFEYGSYGQIQTPLSFGHGGEVTLGFNAGRGKTDARRFVNIGGKRGAKTADSHNISTNLIGYIDVRMGVSENLDFVTGVQAIRSTRRYDDNLTPHLSDHRRFSSLSPKFGMIWHLSERNEIFANISRSYEVPTFSELVQAPVPGFVTLAPQRAWTGEIGTRGRHGVLGWDIALYRADIRGELLQYSMGPDIPAATFNAHKTRHQGIELGLSWDITEALTLRQTYSLNDFTFVKDSQYGGNRLAGLPQHLYRAELTYRTHGITLTPSIDAALSRSYVDFANSQSTPRYAIANLSASYEASSDILFYIEANNLFDKRYISNFGTLDDARRPQSQSVYYPGDGRAIYVGLKWAFGK